MSLPAWGWTTPIRALLGLLALVLGLVLYALSPPGGAGQAPPPALVVDPNTAPPGVLNTLPRLGPTLVARIIEERCKAPFRSLEDLDRRVRGIGPTTIEALRPHLHFESAPEPSRP